MKVAKYTHKSFDGVKTIKGWVLVNNYGETRICLLQRNGIMCPPCQRLGGTVKGGRVMDEQNILETQLI